MAASMKMTAFWDTAPYSLIEVYRRFRVALIMEAGRTSETSITSVGLHVALFQKVVTFMSSKVHLLF
jgi:hypothetical protein